MYTSDFVCHIHQCHATECGCQLNICPQHKAILVNDGVNLVCLYCDWVEPENNPDVCQAE